MVGVINNYLDPLVNLREQRIMERLLVGRSVSVD